MRLIGWLFPALVALPREVGAASYDPDLTWRTLKTPHFNITFHGEEEQLAQEVATVGEQIWAEMTAELDHAPRRPTEIVLVDNTDSANGYAFTLPVNTIVIFVTAPEADGSLSFYQDWNDAILTHEYTHILHLDTVEGLPRLLRGVFGRIVSVNRISPGWIIEGQATFQETRHTPAGRGRSAYVDMVKRVAVLEDEFPPLGNLDGWQAEPPAGNLRYLFGQDFQQFIADRQGEMVWTDFIHTYGGWVPWWLPGRRVFGKGIPRLYREWREEMTARYQAQAERVRAEGLTPFELLSDGVSACAGPTFSPDGQKLVWACTSPTDGSAIFVARGDGSEPEVELKDRIASDFAWRNDSKAFAYSSLHVVKRFNLYDDVYFHELATDDAPEMLTRGQRARDPTFSPDGHELVVVTNEVQNTQLATLTVDRRLEALTERTDHTQYATPRFSPDGTRLAVSVWQDGQRDLWLYTGDARPLRRLTDDLALDVDPAWSADGRVLYFTSDRSGIPNVYAADLETDHLWQVTNVLGGAFNPAPCPDGTRLVFESYSNNGPDIAVMPLDRATWKDRGPLATPGSVDEPGSEQPSPAPAPVPEPPGEEAAPAGDTGVLLPPPPQEDPPDQEPAPRHSKARHDAPRLYVPPDPIPAIDGLGGPFYHARRWPGPWGLPGEGPVARGDRDQPERGPDADEPTGSDAAVPEEADYPFTWPVTRYNPLPTLLPPRFVAPAIYQTSYGFMGVLATSGTDTLRRYLYSGYASYRTDCDYVGWGASLAWNRWIPVYTAGAYSYTVPYGDVYRYPGPPDEGGSWTPSVESANERYWDRRVRSYARVTWPVDTYRTLFAGWNGSLRTPLEPLDASTYRPFLPTRGFLSSISGGWYYAKGKSYRRSISPEDTRVLSVVGELTHWLLGSRVLDDNDQPQPFSQLQVTGEWREYQTAPWLHNHVLAWKIAAGASAGDTQQYGSYRLGGSFGDSGYYTLPDEWRSLRGFGPASVYGDWFYLGSFEYRMPLAYVDRGVGVLPFFARYLSLSAFVDAGNAFDSLDDAQATAAPLVGAGAELRATIIVGWGVGFNVRLGYAFAVLGEGGYALGDLDGVYAWLGSSF